MTGLQRALKIRPGEGRVAFRLLALMLLAWSGSAIGATGVESLLFARFGPSVLPVLYIALGLVTLPTMLGTGALLARSRSPRALALIPLVLAASLLPLRLVVEFDLRWFYPVLWLAMMVVWTAQGMAVWGLAGAVSTTRQAKRLFPLYGAGMILGGAVGGLATRALAVWLHAENLLLVWAVALVAAFFVARSAVGRRRPRGVGARERTRGRPSAMRDLVEGLRYLRASPLLRVMAGALALLSLLYFTLTLPFARAATEQFPEADALAGFLGLFFGLVNVGALVLSLVATNRLFARFGVATMVLVLPIVYVLGFGTLSVQTGFVPIVAFRFVQMVWFNGAWTPAWQALYNVIPPERRAQARAFMDGGALQAGTVLAGVLLLAVDRTLEPHFLFLVGTATAALATLLTWRLRHGYRDAVVEALREGWPAVFVSEDEPFGGYRHDGSAVRALLAAARDPDARLRRVSLEVLAELPSEEADAALAGAVRDPDPDVREIVFRALVRRRIAAAVGEVVPSLSDGDPAVRARAVDALGVCGATAEELARHVGPLLADPEPAPRARAAALLRAREAHPEAGGTLRAMADDPRLEWRIAAIEAIGDAGVTGDGLDSAVTAALSDPDAAVRRAAATAVGRLGDEALLTALMPALGDDDPIVQQEAAGAAAAIADARAILPALAIPRLEAGAVLALRQLPPPPPQELRGYAAHQAGRAVEHHAMWSSLQADGDESIALLAHSLRRRALEHADNALRALAAFEDAEAMDLAVESLRSRDPGQVANALETLETVGDRDVVAPILALWEGATPRGGDPGAVVSRLLREEDPWLRASAAMAARVVDEPDVRAHLEQLSRSDPVPFVREVASWTLRGGSMDTLTTLPMMERVLFLRRVSLFADLSPADLKHVAESAVERVYADGEVLAATGETGDEMHVVVAGEIKVMAAEGDGEVELARRREGDHVGEMAVISGEPRMATLIAAGTVRTLTIDRPRFERIVLERPQVSLAVMRALCDRLREAYRGDRGAMA